MTYSSRLDKNIEDLFEKNEKFTFLVGAGISMNPPSLIPSARDFVHSLLEIYSPEEDVDALLNLKDLRYEIVCDKIQEFFDKDFRFLDYFDNIENTNIIHILLAQLIISGHYVVTTNFDYMIEKALKENLPTEKHESIIPVITKDDFQTYMEPQKLVDNGKYSLYKIHGSKRDIIKNINTQESIITTITALGKNREEGETFAIEAFKKDAVINLFQGRTLIVMGYSGMDDFDIGPTLKEFPDLRKIIWIEHSNEKISGEVINKIPGFEGSNFKGSDKLLLEIRSDVEFEIVKIYGDTIDVVTKLIWSKIIPDIPIPNNEELKRKSKELNFNDWAKKNIEEQPLDKKYRLAMEIFHDLGNIKELERCVNHGIKKDNPYVKEYPYLNLAVCHYYKGDMENAKKNFEISLKICEEIDFKQDIAWNLSSLGNIYMGLGDIQKGLELLEKAQIVTEKLNDPFQKAAVLGGIAGFYETTRDHDKALELYKQCLKIDEEHGILNNKSIDLRAIARIYMYQEKWEEAFEILNESLQIAHQLVDEKSLANIHNNLGNYWQIKKDWDKALHHYMKSLNFNERMNIQLSLANSLQRIGDIYKIKNDFVNAKAYYHNSLQIYQKLTPVVDFAYLMRSIAQLFVSEKKYNEALLTYKEALKIAEQTIDPNVQAQILNSMGVLLDGAKLYDSALDCYTKAINLFKEGKNDQAVDAVMKNIENLKQKRDKK